MDCSLIQGDFIPYHFATLEDEGRARVEAHLLDCKGCLRTYLALKNHVDRGSESHVLPSEASRLAIRATIEARFRPTRARRLRSWLIQPIPLYQSLAVAAVVLASATLGPLAARQLGAHSTADVSHHVDTSRTTSESLSIY